jgi:hypothetical protein
VNFRNYITILVFISDKLYGLLDFSRPDGEQWSESDTILAGFILILLTDVLIRRSMQFEIIAVKENAET